MEKPMQSWYSARQRLSAFLLTAVILLSSIGIIPGTVLGAESSAEICFSVSGSELTRSVKEAVLEKQQVHPEEIDFTNGKTDRFQNLFFSEGRLYEAYPQFEEDGGPDAQLRVFVRMDEEEWKEGEPQIDGDEELIFLYVNHTDETIRFRTEITRTDLEGEEHIKKLGAVTVKSYEEAFGEEEDWLAAEGTATPADAREEKQATPSTATSSQAAQEGKKPLSRPGGSDLVGLDWCSTAKVKTASLNALKALEDVEGFRVEYTVEPEKGLADIKGPAFVPKGNGLRFRVDPEKGYGIASVTVNGEEIAPDQETKQELLATPSETVLKTVKTVYEQEEVEQDAQVVICLEETQEGRYRAEIAGGDVYETIQKAIDESADGDTIRILADTDEESVRIAGKKLTIDLDGHTWIGREEDSDDSDASEPGSVITAMDSSLTITGAGTIQAPDGYRAVTLKDTKLVIGQEDEEGPEILGSLQEGQGITREEDSRRGGVILALGGEITFNSGRIAGGYIEGNSHQEATPSEAKGAWGGGVAVLDGQFRMNGGIVEDNQVDNGYGGGIYVCAAKSMTIKKGEFSHNTAKNGLGGAIYVEGSDQEEPVDIRLDDVTVKENQAGFGGAAAIGGGCRTFSITEQTKTYENQALGDCKAEGKEAGVSDEFLICSQEAALSDEFRLDERSADEKATIHKVEGEDGFYTLAFGGRSDFGEEAVGYCNLRDEDGLLRYSLDDTLHYEDENISVAIQIEGTATVSEEEALTATAATAQKGLVLEAVPIKAEQPEYEAAKAYAQETAGEEGVVSVTALEMKFYHKNQALDVSGCTITAQITPKEPVLAAARQAAAVTPSAAPEAERGVELTALQSRGEELEELGTLLIEGDGRDVPMLTVPVDNANNVLMVSARSATNPHFFVQYYANVEVARRDDGGYLQIIDTDNGGQNRGGILPVNGTDPKITKLYLEDAGNGKRKVQMESQLKELYSRNEYDYFSAPALPYVNVFRANGNYQAQAVWVLKEGKDPASTNPEDWNIYEPIINPTELHFTNNPENPGIEAKTTILIEEGTVIRLVANSTTADYANDVIFYDYDITDDGRTTWDGTGGAHGINRSSNYSGGGAKLAFGNANTGTGLENESWDGNTLNQYNHTGNGFHGCTFGLVESLDENGHIQYADGVAAPKLFGEGEASGKTAYHDFKLGFNRNGDTYTLSSVNGANLDGLEYFNNPATGTTVYDHIWTNNFWPMDGWPGKDGLTGNYMDRGEYSGYDGVKLYPTSDDGLDHNNMFGMQYSVNFTLTEDYVGPLEYYFFGDDDMWVFLDGRLVCDIGGVHSSVGAYVNLWDYIAKGTEGTHTLSFYYTERGLSGSTCYMQFTLPSVSSAEPEYFNSGLRIEKQVEGPADPEQEFAFQITLKYADGSEPQDDYAIVRHSASGESIESSLLHAGEGSFRLKANEYVIIDYLPHGAVYTITEDAPKGCTVSNTIDDEDVSYSVTAEGTIVQGEAYNTVVYTNTFRPRLPDTGGGGIFLYTFGGMALMALPPAYHLSRRKKENES